MKNKVLHTFLLTLFVVIGLAALQFLPHLTIAGYELRPVRLLSDVCQKTEDEALLSDTLPVVKPAFKEECPPGVTLIEDYSYAQKTDSSVFVGRGMAAFYEALAISRSASRPVRIAYFGDSFIEGDILTADLRSMLQTTYGGSGVGYVDVASPTAGFRQSVRAYSQGWSSHSITDTIWFDRKRQGPAERYYAARGRASIQLSGLPGKGVLHQDTCEVSTFYLRADGGLSVGARINGGETQYFYPSDGGEMQQCQVAGRIGRVQWQVNDSTGATFYGVAMEGHHGVSLDNFSLRGSSGLTLMSIPDATLQAFTRLRSYDLVVLQFGLNVANKKTTDYSHYQHAMEKVVRKISTCFPDASILIVGVGDRGERRDGEVVTMRGVKNLIRYQQQLAYRTGCCFWNLYEAMGGEGSMARMAEGKPSLANKDYTHINFRGGKHLAQFFYDALRAGKKNYDKRKLYEAGNQ